LLGQLKPQRVVVSRRKSRGLSPEEHAVLAFLKRSRRRAESRRRVRQA
jgi:hypothetical protein